MRKNLSYQSFLRVLAALLASLCVGWSAIAQERGYDLDLKLRNATVKSFTDAFSRQTGVAFSFGSELAGKELGDIEVQASSKSLESTFGNPARIQDRRKSGGPLHLGRESPDCCGLI